MEHTAKLHGFWSKSKRPTEGVLNGGVLNNYPMIGIILAQNRCSSSFSRTSRWGADPLHHFGQSVLNVNGRDSPQGVMEQGHGILPPPWAHPHHPRARSSQPSLPGTDGVFAFILPCIRYVVFTGDSMKLLF